MRGHPAAPSLDAWRGGAFMLNITVAAESAASLERGAGPRGDRLLRASREGLG